MYVMCKVGNVGKRNVSTVSICTVYHLNIGALSTVCLAIVLLVLWERVLYVLLQCAPRVF